MRANALDGEIGNFNGKRTLRYLVGEDITDALVSRGFGEGSFNGLGLLFEVGKLGDEACQTYAGTKERRLEFIQCGRTCLPGVNYEF